MMGFSPFYYRTTRKTVVSFGNLFKDLTLVKYNYLNNPWTEIERRIVPLTYASKENYIKRLIQQPELPSSVEIKLPGMSFEMTSMAYDPSRKLQSAIQNYNQPSGSTGTIATQYSGVPYNLQFSLYIYIRNIDDGLQIVEQIFPFFGPDYTLTMDFIDEMNITRNIPIILDSVDMPTEYEGDASETERRLVWTLNFTIQTNFYGPIDTGGPITETIVNFDSMQTSPGDQLVLSTANTPLGNFTLGETVFQGPTLALANAVGQVILWNPVGGQLTISMVSGQFISNANVYGTNFGSTVEVTSIPNGIIFAKVIDTPVPNNIIDLDGDFGFSTQIIEFPYAGSYTPPAGEGGSGGGAGAGGGNGGGPSPGGSGGNYQVDVYNNGLLEVSNAAVNFVNTAAAQFLIAANGALVDISFISYATSNNSIFNTITANSINISTIGNFTSVTGTTTSDNTQFAIDNFPASLYNTVKYLVQLSDVNGIHTTELLSIQDGVNTYMTEYATLISANSLGTFSTNLAGTTFNLNYTPYNPGNNIITFKIIRQTVTT